MLGKSSFIALIASALGPTMMAECPSPISTTEIEIYPSAESLPENLLRFYLYFPRPMGRLVSDSEIALINSDGEDLSQAFLPMRYDLWSSDRRRLTLILDPGRVKTGLASHQAYGRALTAGDTFELQVMSSATDSNGCSLGTDANFGFSVHAADLEPPAPETWSIESPTAGSRDALNVDLRQPHDHLSMAYRIRVQSEDDQPIAGRIELKEKERIWSFIPRDPWTTLPHKIVIDERLEDLAGNRPGVAFDRAPDVPEMAWARELTFLPQSE